MKNTSFHFAKFFGYFLKNGEKYIKNQIKSNYSAILGFIWICLYNPSDLNLILISADDESSLLNKKRIYEEETQTNQALKIVMISSDGLAGTAHQERISHVITLNDLFDA